MASSNRNFRNTREVRKAAVVATEFTFQRHHVEHLWKVPSAAARKFWTPILGPTTAAMADLIGETTQDGPVTMTPTDVMMRLGIRKRDVLAAGVHRSVVYLGAIPKFGDEGRMTLSLPDGVYPPGAELRRKYSPELASEFSAYLQKVKVTLMETRSQPAAEAPAGVPGESVNLDGASIA